MSNEMMPDKNIGKAMDLVKEYKDLTSNKTETMINEPMTSESKTNETNTKNDFLPINGTDYVEFYVGNAKQAAHFYKTAFGFQSVAYAGPETGVKDTASYMIQQGKIRFVLTSALRSNHPVAHHVLKHGDGVKVLALWVDDAYKAHEETVKRGGRSFLEPETISDENGEIKRSGIYTYGETIHIFIERKDYKGLFLPGFEPYTSSYNPDEIGLLHVDHCVGNVGWHQMNKWVDFYEDTMGFKNILTFDDKAISTEYSALMSKVMSNGNGYVKFPINEPAEGKRKSQIEEYLEFYEGEGVQHIAIATADIVDTVKKLKAKGIEFLNTPDAYYDNLIERVGEIDEDVKVLRAHKILVDTDEEGYLLQIFTKPIQDRPTVFFEIIQRKGAQSFGAGNFKALFEAIEREQALRGNL